ncbi:MAG: glutaredoxin 3 [Pseudomonadota bacterium]|nr:glutaredoxin 3 [Pseudomonadota bacterium]
MNDIKMYTTAICPYCAAAKGFLARKGLVVEEIRVDTDPARRAEMMEKTRRMTVPQIFVNGHHVGGYDDLVALDRKGGLDPLLINN